MRSDRFGVALTPQVSVLEVLGREIVEPALSRGNNKVCLTSPVRIDERVGNAGATLASVDKYLHSFISPSSPESHILPSSRPLI